MLQINLLSPSSGRLNLVQVNCFTPSSECQCSTFNQSKLSPTRLKQMFFRNTGTIIPHGVETQDTMWVEELAQRGINAQASWYLSLHAKKFHLSDSRTTRGHVTHYWLSLHPSRGKKHTRARTNTQTIDFWVNFTPQAEWKHTWIRSIRNRPLNMNVWGQCSMQYVTVETCGLTIINRHMIKVHTTHWKKTSYSFNYCN